LYTLLRNDITVFGQSVDTMPWASLAVARQVSVESSERSLPMSPEDGMKPEDDIQQAVHQAQSLGNAQADSAPADASMASDTLVHSQSCPVRHVRYAIYKCGLMGEKYPCQTTAALLVTAGCGWLCAYFGLTVLAGLLVYAVCAEE
jgi:hypothetical protein